MRNIKLELMIMRSFVLLFFLFCQGCSKNHLHQQTCPVKVTHVFKGQKLININSAKDKICVFSAQTSTGQEQYRNVASSSLANALRENSDNFEVLSFSDFANEINKAGLSQRYLKTINFYRKTAMFRESDLKEIGKKTGVKYFFVPSLLNIKRWDAGRISVASVKLLVTQKICIVVAMEIWTADGHNIFGVISDITIADEKIKEEPISIEESFEKVWSLTIKKLEELELKHEF